MPLDKHDTMINLMPDLWRTTMQQDFDDDDDDTGDYGRLVIDIPDSPGVADDMTEKTNETDANGNKNVEFTDDPPTPVAEKKTSNSTVLNSTVIQGTTKPTESKVQKVLPVRRNRDVPIKLLLKRSFQNIRIKPHTKRLKDYNTENERKKLNEHKSDQKEPLPNIKHNLNQVKPHERTDRKYITTTDINLGVFPHNYTYDTTVCVVKPNSQNRPVKSHKKESLCIQKHNHVQVVQVQEHKKLLQETNKPHSVPEKDIHVAYSDNDIKNTAFVVRPKTQNKLIDSIRSQNNKDKKTLPTPKRGSKVSNAKQTITHITPDGFNQRTYQETIKYASPISPSGKQYIMDNFNKQLISACENYLDKEQKTIINSHTAADNFHSRTAFRRSVRDTTNPLASLIELEIQCKQKEELAKRLIDTYNSNIVKTHKITDGALIVADKNQITTPPNNKENNEENTNLKLYSSTPSQSYQTPQHENPQRISVVSNDFLFRHRSLSETIEIPTETNSRSQINSDERQFPQLYQEALIDFMEQQYQLALRENIPLTVNRKPLNQEPFIEIPDTNLTEVINIEQATSVQDVVKNTTQSQQKSNFVNQGHLVSANQNITKNVPIGETSPNSDSQSGYNILVHRGPDVNRIVITLATEGEEKNDTVNQPFSGDQRVPDSTNNLYSEASPPNDRRSYYYKEPSLRSFRKRSPHQRVQKQTKNTNKRNRFDPIDHFLDNHKNAAFAHHYSYIGNHHELPSPVLESYYNLENQHYPAHAFNPWELRDCPPIALERVPKRSQYTKSNVHSSQKQYHLDPHEEQILFGPLNLSLKPLTANETPHPQMNSKIKYPLLQSYY